MLDFISSFHVQDFNNYEESFFFSIRRQRPMDCGQLGYALGTSVDTSLFAGRTYHISNFLLHLPQMTTYRGPQTSITSTRPGSCPQCGHLGTKTGRSRSNR